jgi:predicted negative regulator of RcsB-dependent stress response
MATLESNDSNIIDGQEINLRLIVYPILAIIVIVVGGLTYYYYQQNKRDAAEADARAAMLKAQTPEELVQVADQYPHTDQATQALLKAADDSFTKLDYTASAKDYQRILDTTGTDPLLRDSAQVGLASALEASGKIDEAIAAYMEVANRGDKTPYAPFAYNAVYKIYVQKGDTINQRKILTQESTLDPDSNFVKQAQQELKSLDAGSINLPVPAAAKP